MLTIHALSALFMVYQIVAGGPLKEPTANKANASKNNGNVDPAAAKPQPKLETVADGERSGKATKVE